MANIKDIRTALSLFEEAAIAHAEATEQGDYETGSKCYATIAKTITFLKEKGEISVLLIFLNHVSVGVRLWAATHLLLVHEVEGVKVLEEIVATTGIHSFTAKTTLSEWQKGNLKI